MLRAQGSGVKAIIYIGKLLPNEYYAAVERTVSGPKLSNFANISLFFSLLPPAAVTLPREEGTIYKDLRISS